MSKEEFAAETMENIEENQKMSEKDVECEDVEKEYADEEEVDKFLIGHDEEFIIEKKGGVPFRLENPEITFPDFLQKNVPCSEIEISSEDIDDRPNRLPFESNLCAKKEIFRSEEASVADIREYIKETQKKDEKGIEEDKAMKNSSNVDEDEEYEEEDEEDEEEDDEDEEEDDEDEEDEEEDDEDEEEWYKNDDSEDEDEELVDENYFLMDSDGEFETDLREGTTFGPYPLEEQQFMSDFWQESERIFKHIHDSIPEPYSEMKISYEDLFSRNHLSPSILPNDDIYVDEDEDEEDEEENDEDEEEEEEYEDKDEEEVYEDEELVDENDFVIEGDEEFSFELKEGKTIGPCPLKEPETSDFWQEDERILKHTSDSIPEPYSEMKSSYEDIDASPNRLSFEPYMCAKEEMLRSEEDIFIKETQKKVEKDLSESIDDMPQNPSLTLESEANFQEPSLLYIQVLKTNILIPLKLSSAKF